MKQDKKLWPVKKTDEVRGDRKKLIYFSKKE